MAKNSKMKNTTLTKESRLQKIDRELLTPVVRKALDSPELEVTRWEATLLKGRADAGMVFRIEGEGSEPLQGRSDWSVIAKIGRVIAREEASKKENFREVRFYEAGVGENFPGGFRAPTCWGVTHIPGDMPWIWLEDVKGALANEWTSSRHVLGAFHLGQFQGAFLVGRPLPEDPVLDRRGELYRDMKNCVERMLPEILEKTGNHPLAKSTYGGKLGKRLMDLAGESRQILEAIARTPLTFCHRDFGGGNILSHTLPDGSEETVGLDWDFCGIGQIGIETQGLISSYALRSAKSVGEAQDFKERIFDSYIEGIRDAGWKGEPGVARYACTAILALQGSFHLAIHVNMLLNLWGEKSQSRIDRYAELQEYLLDLAEEAGQLEKYVN